MAFPQAQGPPEGERQPRGGPRLQPWNSGSWGLWGERRREPWPGRGAISRLWIRLLCLTTTASGLTALSCLGPAFVNGSNIQRSAGLYDNHVKTAQSSERGAASDHREPV